MLLKVKEEDFPLAIFLAINQFIDLSDELILRNLHLLWVIQLLIEFLTHSEQPLSTLKVTQ
ncbi:hypothetical protein D3C86_1895710 [compost metagenome]